MRKKCLALMTAGCIILSVCGCGNNETENPDTPVIPIIIEDEPSPGINDPDTDGAGTDGRDIPDTDLTDTDPSGDGIVGTDTDSDETGTGITNPTGPESADESALSFTDFQYLTFGFSSGVGAWGTELSIRADGTFSGEYHDSDMGDFGDNYPNGTVHQCTFNGQFSHPVKVNDYTYSMQILSINYAKEPDTSEIKNGTYYHYTTPYGLNGAETLLIYLPGAPLAELPEGYRSWVGYYYLESTTDTELPFYGLYNEAEAEGFSSYSEWENLKYNVEYIEEQAAIIEDALVNDATLSQGDLNVKSGELYELWDSMLNIIWKALQRVNDADTMRALTDEQLKWIAEKEQAVEEAGAEVEGGSLYPLITNTIAADLTKARVYELLALLEP